VFQDSISRSRIKLFKVSDSRFVGCQLFFNIEVNLVDLCQFSTQVIELFSRRAGSELRLAEVSTKFLLIQLI